MRALVTHRAGRIHNAQRFDMVLGEVFDVELLGIRGGVDWNANNDEVLQIEDDATSVARITATAVGKSTITLTQHDRFIGRLYIEVFIEPTTTVGMKFGNVRDRQA